jgi:hypothetical protein
VPDGVQLEVILDCCHAGTGTRELVSFGASPVNAVTNLSTLEPTGDPGDGWLAPRDTQVVTVSTVSKVTARYLEPPLDQQFYVEYLPHLPRQKLLARPEYPFENGELSTQGYRQTESGRSRQVVVTPQSRHVLWAAARDNQVSEETNIGGRVRGVFTYYYCEILRRTNGRIGRARLDSLVSAAVRRAGFSQVPQLEASEDKLRQEIFPPAGAPVRAELSPV